MLRPPDLLQLVPERRDPGLPFIVALGVAHQHADASHALGLLRPPRERPRRCAAEQRDEFATVQLIEFHPKAGYRIGSDQSVGFLEPLKSVRLPSNPLPDRRHGDTAGW